MKIVTFNLRCPWEDPDGINGFINRVGRIVNKIRTEMPDVICFQEATEKNRDFLEDALADYFFICNQRNSNFDGEGLMTAINKKTVSILGLDFFGFPIRRIHPVRVLKFRAIVREYVSL